MILELAAGSRQLRSMSTRLAQPMGQLMTTGTQGDEVFVGVITELAPPIYVVHLKIT
jgi:hypothetical protein